MSITLHTSVGDLKLELFCHLTPKTCKNFLALAASDYYAGCIFHRVIEGFICQSGDPTNTGKGGESIYGKPFEDEFVSSLKHSARGVLAMANKGPSTNQSQFYITFDKCPHLDSQNTVFGRVIAGFETLTNIEKVQVDSKTDRPLDDIVIKDITIHSNPIAEISQNI
mmetsp:Transcript_20108/g.29895  ORF Transcript_20108/g.29895 Transcript_20108/m.29895 type:complete len:167 (-) Transcript_20108:27-527(-)